MPTDLVQIATGLGIAFVSLTAFVFILNRLGWHVWIWWVNHGKLPSEDSAAKKYWSVDE